MGWKYRCLNGNVVAKRFEAEKVTPGGIVLPDGSERKNERAIVVAHCQEPWLEDGQRRETALQVGDMILIDKYTGRNFNADDDQYCIVKERDILVHFEPDEESDLPLLPSRNVPTMTLTESIQVPAFEGVA